MAAATKGNCHLEQSGHHSDQQGLLLIIFQIWYHFHVGITYKCISPQQGEGKPLNVTPPPRP